jgi:hypothetical protein
MESKANNCGCDEQKGFCLEVFVAALWRTGQRGFFESSIGMQTSESSDNIGIDFVRSMMSNIYKSLREVQKTQTQLAGWDYIELVLFFSFSLQHDRH